MFGTGGDKIAVLESVLLDRSKLTLNEVIDRIQNDLKGPSQGIASAIKTICQRYFSNTAVSSNLLLETFQFPSASI